MSRGVALASDATAALGGISAAIEDTARVASEVAEHANVMRSANSTVTGEMSSFSTIVDSNGTAAQHMQSTSTDVLAIIAPIAETALAQTGTADAVSAATAELAAQVQEMDTTPANCAHKPAA